MEKTLQSVDEGAGGDESEVCEDLGGDGVSGGVVVEGRSRGSSSQGHRHCSATDRPWPNRNWAAGGKP